MNMLLPESPNFQGLSDVKKEEAEEGGIKKLASSFFIRS